MSEATERRHPMAPVPPEELALWDRWVGSGRTDFAARDALVERYARLAFAISFSRLRRRPAGVALDEDDVESSALSGLLRAVELFDPARGVRFTTYATRSVHRWITNADRWTPEGRRWATYVTACSRAKKDGRPAPSPPPRLPRRVSFGDWIAAGGDVVAPPDDPGRAELGRLALAAVESLPPRLRRVVRGWLDGELQAVTAAELGVTRSRVSWVLRDALVALRRRLPA